MRFVVELNSADYRKVAGSADNEVEMFGRNAIERALPSRVSQARFDRRNVSHANLPEEPSRPE